MACQRLACEGCRNTKATMQVRCHFGGRGVHKSKRPNLSVRPLIGKFFGLTKTLD
jgi:hypothetical protein